jgi:hypothetical protein
MKERKGWIHSFVYSVFVWANRARELGLVQQLARNRRVASDRNCHRAGYIHCASPPRVPRRGIHLPGHPAPNLSPPAASAVDETEVSGAREFAPLPTHSTTPSPSPGHLTPAASTNPAHPVSSPPSETTAEEGSLFELQVIDKAAESTKGTAIDDTHRSSFSPGI